MEYYIKQPTAAGLVVDELESRCAVALEADNLVLADVRAAAIVHKALVNIWSERQTRRSRQFRL